MNKSNTTMKLEKIFGNLSNGKQPKYEEECLECGKGTDFELVQTIIVDHPLAGRLDHEERSPMCIKCFRKFVSMHPNFQGKMRKILVNK